MANANVPLKFEIWKGDDLLKEEVLNEPVIKVGKLASSHLRIDDDSVSRMHAVIEVNGQDDVQLIDLGSTRGTLVNGERITKVRLRSGDEINFGDVRVVVAFLDEEESTVVAPHVSAAAAALPAARPSAPPSVSFASGTAPIPPYQPPAATGQLPSYGTSPPPPPASSWAPPAGATGSHAQVAADVEELDGSRALEVQAMFRGVVVNTRHLFDPGAKALSGQARTMILGGILAVMIAFCAFVYTVLDVGKEKMAYEAHLSANKESRAFIWRHRSPAMDAIVFIGFALGIGLVYMGLKRRHEKHHDYIIGADPHADAPVANEYTGGAPHALVKGSGRELLVNVTPAMSGEVNVDGQAIPLQMFVQQRGPSFALPDRGRARIEAGETTFQISSTARPRALETPFLIWKWSEQVYTVGSAVAVLLFLLMIFSVPPDPKSLSLDLFNSDNRFVNFLIKPPEEKEEEIPEWLKKRGPDEQGGKGKRHKGDEGKMGKKTSKNKEGLYGLKGPKENIDPHLAKKLAEEEIQERGHPRRAQDGRGIPHRLDLRAGHGPRHRRRERPRRPDRQPDRRGLRRRRSGPGGDRRGRRRHRGGDHRSRQPRHHRQRWRGWFRIRLRSRRRWPRRPSGAGAGGSPRAGQRARLARQGDHPPHHPATHQRGEVLLRAGAHPQAGAGGPGGGSVHHRGDGTGRGFRAPELDHGQRPGRKLRRAVGAAVGVPQAAGRRYRHRHLSVQLHARRRRRRVSGPAPGGENMTASPSATKALLAIVLSVSACDIFVGRQRINAIDQANRGIEAFNSGLYDTAEQQMKLSIQTDPTYHMAHYNLGKVYQKQRKWEKAIEAFEGATQRDTGNSNYFYDLGEAYFEAKQLEKAEVALRKSAELDPKLFKAHWRLGQVYIRLERPKEADGALRKAIEANARLDKPFVDLGHLYLDYDAAKEASQVFSECVRANEHSSECFNGWGLALKDLRQFEQATTQFKRALELEPGLTTAVYNAGMTYADWYEQSRSNDHKERAREYLQKYVGNAGAKEGSFGYVKAANDKLYALSGS